LTTDDVCYHCHSKDAPGTSAAELFIFVMCQLQYRSVGFENSEEKITYFVGRCISALLRFSVIRICISKKIQLLLQLRQGVAYRHIILLALYLKFTFRRSSHSNRQKLQSL